jgi:alanine racemase
MRAPLGSGFPVGLDYDPLGKATMPRPIVATISVPALTHNLDVVRRHVDAAAVAAGGQPPAIWAVIKANAYGHGIETAVTAFSAAQGLAMLDLAEAVRCREAGWVGPIMLLEGLFEAADLALADRYHLTCAVHDEGQIDMLAHAHPSRPLDVFLKLNTGMNRLGFTEATFPGALARLVALQARGVVGHIGCMTHFATADSDPGIAAQYAIFQRATAQHAGSVSVCNSAATLRHTECAVGSAERPSWVRPGICLYGASPFADVTAAEYGLKPAMTLSSRLIGVQQLVPGARVGYGATFAAERDMRIGVVACGYADGYPRHAPTGTPIEVAGVRTRVVGRVSMDMLTVDLTDVPQAAVGSKVVLWGEDGPSVDDVATASGTIGYELLCAVARRVPTIVHY